jgi:hypothetical protein
MDLQTGEKWVKLPDNDEDQHPSASSAQSDRVKPQGGTSSSLSLSSAVVTADGETQHGEMSDGQESDSSPEDKERGEVYDYEMMHRTLNQLPAEEKARMQLPDAPRSDLTAEQRDIFERKMKMIWERRQEEIRRFEREFVADLPQILRARIARLRQYIKDPHPELLELNLGGDTERSSPEKKNESSDELEEGGGVSFVTHIVSVLADLEYHLADIDMTRDFYALGGWPLLVTLLLDETHNDMNGTASVNSTASTLSEEELQDSVHVVQAHAAWALGTAVKNTDEFAPYVVETLVLVDQRTSALKVLLDQISSFVVVDDGASMPAQDKLLKYLYALGSFLRGNPLAQRQFTSHGGGAILGRLLQSYVPSIELNARSRKLVHRVLSIADDVMTEIAERAQEDSDARSLAHVFTTPAWCESILQTLRTQSPLQPFALRTCRALATGCREQHGKTWSDSVRTEAVKLSSRWLADAEADAENAEGAQEGVDLARSVLAILQ